MAGVVEFIPAKLNNCGSSLRYALARQSLEPNPTAAPVKITLRPSGDHAMVVINSGRLTTAWIGPAGFRSVSSGSVLMSQDESAAQEAKASVRPSGEIAGAVGNAGLGAVVMRRAASVHGENPRRASFVRRLSKC